MAMGGYRYQAIMLLPVLGGPMSAGRSSTDTYMRSSIQIVPIIQVEEPS